MVLFLLHVSGLLFVNTLGVVGEDTFNSFKSFWSIGGVRGLTLETRTGGGQTQTPTHGEVGGGAGGG